MQKYTKYLSTVAAIVFVLILSGIAVNYTLSQKQRQKAAAANVQQVQQNNTVQTNTQLQESAAALKVSQTIESSNEMQMNKKPQVIKYTIKAGDTLSAIAKQYNINVNTITWSNGISDTTLLKEGKELHFPSIKGMLYTVKNGDTLWDISYTYDTDVADIVDANYLESQDSLKIGQAIILPGATPPQPAKKTVVVSSVPVKKVQSTSRTAVKVASRSRTVSISQSNSGGMWPLSGVITSRFGMRWGRLHKGIDIAASTGTDVHAFRGGKVVFSGWDNGGYGKLVIIDHGNGLETYYGHNSKLFVSVGETVSKGQHISDVGSTGDSTGPHCHFEIRKNGVPVNPLSYLP